MGTPKNGGRIMERISKAIAKHSKLILLLAVILVVPAAFGYFKTDVNYDILSYLPEETSTMQAEKIGRASCRERV